MLDHDRINKFIKDCNEMVLQLGEYIAMPEYERNEQDSGDVRRLRVVVDALSGACDAVGRMPGPVPVINTMPPPPPPLTQPMVPGDAHNPPPPQDTPATPRRRGAPVNPTAPSNYSRL